MSVSTEKERFPDTDILLSALHTDTYEKEGDFSTTEILKPPQVTFLKHRHKPRSLGTYAKWRSFVGTAIHNALEDHGKKHFPNAIIEERLFHDFEINGETVTLGGKSDVIFPGYMISDYKVVLEAGCPTEAKPEHFWQNQFNAFLAHKNGIELKYYRVEYVLDDWRHTNYTKSRNAPKEPRKPFIGEILPMDEIERFLLKCLTEHYWARNGKARPCTDEERWKKEDVWALAKPGAKKARKLCRSQQEVKDNQKNGEVVEFRAGKYVRCEDWCEFSNSCPQFNS